MSAAFHSFLVGIALLLAAPPTLAAPLALAAEPSNTNASKRAELVLPVNSTTTCGFVGNQDVYGLGIRVGIYLQAMAVTIASFSGQTLLQRKLSLGTAMFQLALLIGLSLLTATLKDLQAVEAAITCLLALISCLGSPVDLREVIQRPLADPAELRRWMIKSAFWLVNHLMKAALFCYSLWFWYVGLDKLPHSVSCTTYAFFFARVDMYSWFRFLGRIYITLLVLELLYLEISILIAVVGAEKLKQVLGKLLPLVTYTRPSEPRPRGSRLARAIPGLLYTFILLFILLSVELMIRWNGITGVSDLSNVGQLIALFAGCGGIATLVLEWEERQEELVAEGQKKGNLENVDNAANAGTGAMNALIARGGGEGQG
ncbi:hypothetical protein ABW19_dt0210459 [Dactylella cylindrospora]|nr:hypothetical protein ABW19_dt0210459 [Dactylella cylindrospora]